MSGFRNFFSKLTQQPPPQTQQKPQNKLLVIWNKICACTLTDNKNSLLELGNYINLLLKEIQTLLQSGLMAQINETLSMHQIPKQLVSFGNANIPKGLINEVVRFFASFTKSPFSTLLSEPYIIAPLNNLLENTSPICGHEEFFELVTGILHHITTNPDHMLLFLISEESCPLIHQFSMYLVTNYDTLGDVLIQILVYSKNKPELLTFIVMYSPIVSTLVDLCRDIIENKADSPEKNDFLEYINVSMLVSPADFVQAFAALFDEIIIKPLIIRADALQGLSLSIFMLCSFTASPLIKPIYEYIFSNFECYMRSNMEEIVYLTIRCFSLMIETSATLSSPTNQIIFPDPPPLVKVSLDFMGLINAEWFVQPNINQQLLSSRAHVSMMLSNLKTENGANLVNKISEVKDDNDDDDYNIILDLKLYLQQFLELLAKFADNSFRVNVALTELFATIAVISGSAATYFALSDDCPDGLYRTLSTLCVMMQRRIGQRPGTIQLISDAYEKIAELPEMNDAENGVVPPQEELVYFSLVVLIEFLKELHAIAQSKNLLHQRDSTIMKDYFL